MIRSGRSSLRIFPYFSLAVFLLPVLIGLLGTWLPAMGYLPAIGADTFTLQPFFEFFDHPSTSKALITTLVSGIGAPLLALTTSLWIIITVYGTPLWTRLSRMLAPLLAIPHASFAIGFAFLIAPSGWLLRLISPELSGFTSPPDFTLVKDPYGISLTLALAIKEVPFLLLMGMGALNQLDINRIRWVGGSLGYHNFRIWSRLILPQIYPQLRLPVLAVLAYSLSVVDISMILGPTIPPTLPVLLNRWFNDPAIASRLTGAAGASFLFFLVGTVIALFLLLERLWQGYFSAKLIDGRRKSPLDIIRPTGAVLTWLMLLTTFASLLTLLFWSCTRSWRFPASFPTALTLRFWYKGIEQALPALINSGLIGVTATLIATILVLGCLEYEVVLTRTGHTDHSQKMIWILYLPLLVPQISFIFGIQTIVVFFHLDGKLPSLIASHLIFVLPYVFLTISQVYRTYDQRYMQIAATMGISPIRNYFRVKIPMLLKPIAFGMATGFSVSVVQYLPTLYVGAGRFATITTETVNLAAGADRRIIGVYGLLQFLLPVCGFCISLLIPALLFRGKKGMQN